MATDGNDRCGSAGRSIAVVEQRVWPDVGNTTVYPTYELHRTGRTQEDHRLLREGREWPDPTGRQGWIDPTRAGRLDEDSAPAVDRGDGGDDLQRLALRSPASARHSDQGGSPVDAASDSSGQEEERP